jgi:hypothetical protein
MSGPTRGMVAGQAITTQAQTKEFDEGYERIFGKAKPARGRFVYRDGEAINVDRDWVGTDSEKPPVFTDRYMEGDRATDGTDIGNRTRRRNYMEKNGLADSSDYTGHWQKAESQRAAFYEGRDQDKGLHETIGRALHEAKKKRRR